MPIDVVERSDDITMVVINNPAKRNALDESMYRALAQLWSELTDTSSPLAVVVTGAGRAFLSSGSTLKDWPSKS